jgi:hypothetical protein
MSTAQLLEQLKHLSNSERLEVIEAATRLLREDLVARAGSDDPVLRVAGCLSGEPVSASEIERELYGEEEP